MRSSRIWACSLLLLSGCTGFTLGPTVEKKVVIVKAGTAIECQEEVTVKARLLQDEGSGDVFDQDIGGWVMFHPDHWEALKREVKRLRVKAGEEKEGR
jgi:hypothetical protein